MDCTRSSPVTRVAELWPAQNPAAWQHALGRYAEVVAQQGVPRLPDLDRWYHDEFAPAVRARIPMFIQRDELVQVTEWKMARGVFRAANLARVRALDDEIVRRTSREAFRQVPDPRQPIATLATLDGVGPAAASGVLAAAAPDRYPFFDELVAAQVPGLGPVKWTVAYYLRYADALRARAHQLGSGWTPADIERALWSHSGGKKHGNV